MLLSKRNKQILIILFLIGISMSTCFVKKRLQTSGVKLLRAALCTACLFMLFGIFKAHPKHKPKFVITLLSVLAAIFTWLILQLQGITSEFTKTSKNKLKFSFSLGVVVLVTAIIGFIMNVLYNEYVELTQDPVKTEEDKEQPPRYDNLSNVAIAISSTQKY